MCFRSFAAAAPLFMHGSRTFSNSTSRAVRAGPYLPPSSALPPNSSVRRVNPLVGSSDPESSSTRRPTQDNLHRAPPTPTARQTTSSSDIRARRGEDSDADLPPPPPPPNSAPQVNGPTGTAGFGTKASSSHKYDATSKSPGSKIDLIGLISSKHAASTHGLQGMNPLELPKVHTKAVTGRTVFVGSRSTPNGAASPSLAFKMIERLCRDQKIRGKYHSQRFHERKGLKKKRLKSQRWRTRFKQGFRAAVIRVKELKRQGW